MDIKSQVLFVKKEKTRTILFFFSLILFCPSLSYALQTHGPPEGIVVHQIGHIAFILSLTGMFLRIRFSLLKEKRFWRLMSWGAIMLAFWNLWAFTGHELELYLPKGNIMVAPDLEPKLKVDFWLPLFYYIYKMDHLISVPAMIFFYKAMKELLRERG
jgi:hypothetical protein